ncbi:2OG-Fe(II) oxygenase [Sphingobium yanoikuyae]|uniref:2OG-Fe(II) oxygenase n=1 Tax=Sphingobium yanoikuyae TaxID=13690 RepID=UPI000C0E8393|nr:MAG: proline hydroxylase [Sphingobium sp.]
MTALLPLKLNRALNLPALGAAYARSGRVAISDFLSSESAASLTGILRARADWRQVIHSQGKALELTRDVRAQMAREQQDALDGAIYDAARYGFQYRYETIRVPDSSDVRAASDDPLCAFAQWMMSDPVLAVLRQVTGADDICFADAQATAYSPGDFLTGHDDAVAGKGRRAAYVLGLTERWRPEWGGLLMFHDDEGMMEAWPPQPNSLNIFRVPQLHSVSEVTRAAAFRRYSITGWLRNRQP